MENIIIRVDEVFEAKLSTEQALILEQNKKLQDAIMYLKNTDWVELYLIKHYANIELLPSISNKFNIEINRKNAVLFIQQNQGV